MSITVTIDLNKMDRIPDVDCYNNIHYSCKNTGMILLLKYHDDINHVDIMVKREERYTDYDWIGSVCDYEVDKGVFSFIYGDLWT